MAYVKKCFIMLTELTESISTCRHNYPPKHFEADAGSRKVFEFPTRAEETWDAAAGELCRQGVSTHSPYRPQPDPHGGELHDPLPQRVIHE